MTRSAAPAYNILFRSASADFSLKGHAFRRAINLPKIFRVLAPEVSMASHFSAIKRARQTERRTERNRTHTSRLRTVIRGFRETLAGKDKKAAEAQYRETVDHGPQ